jgi:hypothetical protein
VNTVRDDMKNLEILLHDARYDSSTHFFTLEGNCTMKLTAKAARAVCNEANAYRLIVFRVEGGIWHQSGFEARLDCIWDGSVPPLGELAAGENNRLAEQFVVDEQAEHDTFIVSTMKY